MFRNASFAAVLVAASLALAVFSQETTTPSKSKYHSLPSGWKQLKLTKAQTEKAYAVQDSYAPKIDALKRQIADLQQKQKGELLGVLTVAQRQVLIGVEPPAALPDAKK